jgi:hypothetical protein
MCLPCLAKFSGAKSSSSKSISTPPIHSPMHIRITNNTISPRPQSKHHLPGLTTSIANTSPALHSVDPTQILPSLQVSTQTAAPPPLNTQTTYPGLIWSNPLPSLPSLLLIDLRFPHNHPKYPTNFVFSSSSDERSGWVTIIRSIQRY